MTTKKEMYERKFRKDIERQLKIFMDNVSRDAARFSKRIFDVFFKYGKLGDEDEKTKNNN